MTFSEAIAAYRADETAAGIARATWADDIVLRFKEPTRLEKVSRSGKVFHWYAWDTDLVAEDWRLVWIAAAEQKD